MDRTEIMTKIATCLEDVLDEDGIVLVEETTADDVEGWDSMAHVKLIIAMEAEFGIRFESHEFAAPENIGEMVSLIEGKL